MNAGSAGPRAARARRTWEQLRARAKPLPRWVQALVLGYLGTMAANGVLFPPIRLVMAVVLLASVPSLVFLFRWFLPRSHAIALHLTYDEFQERLQAIRAIRRPLRRRLTTMIAGCSGVGLMFAGLVFVINGFIAQPPSTHLGVLLIGFSNLAGMGLNLNLNDLYLRIDQALLGRTFMARYREATVASGVSGLSLILLAFAGMGLSSS